MKIYYNNTGAIVGYAEFGDMEYGNDIFEMLINEIDNPYLYYVYGGNLVKYPDKPDSRDIWSFNFSTKAWQDTRTLADIKLNRLQYVNEQRLAANQSFFIFQDKQIAIDTLSRSDIDGVNGEVSLTGQLPATFPNAWKAMDNTYVNIPDVATWVQFYQAMVQQGTANFIHAQQLKAQIQQATTIEEVEAISW